MSEDFSQWENENYQIENFWGEAWNMFEEPEKSWELGRELNWEWMKPA